MRAIRRNFRLPLWIVAAIILWLANHVTRAGASQGTSHPLQGQEWPGQIEEPLRIRVAPEVQAAKLIHRVHPVYPQEAAANKITGAVVLHAIISTDGSIARLDFVSGPKVFEKAAKEAIRSWRYQPTLVKGKAVEVDTTIRMVFVLGPNEKAWWWFDDCPDGRSMGIDVLLDHKPIYHTELRVCQMYRNDADSRPKQKTIVFNMPGGHTFRNTYHTKKAEKIEGSIWQAGAEPTDLLLGLSFSTRGQVLLNAIHIIDPSEVTTSNIDAGMVVKTYPVDRLQGPD